MIQKRRALISVIIAGGSAIPAGAGCFDWLFHKHHQPVAPVLPYAVGLAPATTVTPLGPPIAVGAPTTSLPAGSAADLAPMVQPSLVTAGYAANYGGLQPATAAQMPAYAMLPAPINNPSVLTGMPVNMGPAPTGNTVAAYYGGMAAPQASYNAAAAYQMQLPASPMGQAAYYQPPAPARSGCCLLGHIFGNRYQTNYNNVPTTVYRPVQQVNPATGQTVIVQQPCTTTTQQVQRTPYTSLQPAQSANVTPAPYYGEPTCGNEPPRYLPPAQSAPLQSQPQYAPQSSYGPQGNAQAGGLAPIGSGLSQATAIAPINGSGLQFGSPQPPTTAPLQGYPGGLPQPGDAVPVEQPRLEAARPSLAPPVITSPAWPGNSGAAYRSLETSRSANDSRSRDELDLQQPARPSAAANIPYSDLPPIPAADEYSPPAWSPPSPGSESSPRDNDVWQPRERWQSDQHQQRPLSPPSLEDRTVSRPIQASPAQGSYERSEPAAARYASSLREPQRQPVRPIAEAPRDDSGWFAIEP